VVSKGSVGIIVNDEIGRYFHTRKGLRRGNWSPILFNLVADILVILVSRAKNNGQFKALVPNLVDEGLSISQCADDTILFMNSDIEGASNLKLVLSKACLASKPISTRANCFALVRLRIRARSLWSSLVTRRATFPFGI